MSTAELTTTAPDRSRPSTFVRILLVALGLVGALLGLWLMANPFAAIWVLGFLVGLSLIVAGASEAVSARHEGRRLLPALVGGVVLVSLGIAAITWPAPTVWVIAVIAGLGFIVGGLASIVGAVRDDDGWRGVNIGLGCISLALGVVVLAWPEATLVIIAFLIGLRTVLSGLLALVVGLRGHSFD